MTDLTFVNSSGQLIVITICFNKIHKVATMQGGIPIYSTLEGLKFNMQGILSEFPDLKGKPFSEMKKIAIQRFKDHLLKMKTERESIKYLKDDLAKHKYKMIMIQRKGFRPERVK